MDNYIIYLHVLKVIPTKKMENGYWDYNLSKTKIALTDICLITTTWNMLETKNRTLLITKCFRSIELHLANRPGKQLTFSNNNLKSHNHIFGTLIQNFRFGLLEFTLYQNIYIHDSLLSYSIFIIRSSIDRNHYAQISVHKY